MQLDNNDKKILTILQQNGRQPIAELASDIGLSPAATLERIRKMELQKVITGYHACLALDKIGLNINLIVKVKLNTVTETNVTAFEARMRSISFITEYYRLIGGSFDYFLKVAATDVKAYQCNVEYVLNNTGLIREMQVATIVDCFSNFKLPIQ